MDRGFDHVPEGGTVGLKNGGEVVDGQFGLLFDGVASQFSGVRIDGAGAGYEDEISGSPSLGVGALWRRSTLGLDFVFGHVVLFLSGQGWCAIRNSSILFLRRIG